MSLHLTLPAFKHQETAYCTSSEQRSIHCGLSHYVCVVLPGEIGRELKSDLQLGGDLRALLCYFRTYTPLNSVWTSIIE